MIEESLVTAPAEADARAVREAVAAARRGLVEREIVSEAVVLCAVAGEHLLVVGAPGTAKSEAVRRVAQQLGGRLFEYVLGRFTEPNEIFGPVDLRKLREGVVEVETSGMLPEADVAFLDEVFLGSTAILNTLLGLLNERTYRRGSTAVDVPLRVCVGASNALPDDPALEAFADRFLVRVFVEPVADARLEELLEAGWDVQEDVGAGVERLMPVVDRLALAARQCELGAVRGHIAAAVRRLRAAGVPVSDRRAVRVQRLVAAAAVLDGRTTASEADLWVLPLIAPTADAQALARDTLADLMGSARNGSLAHAAEELSRGPAARAERLAVAGDELLAGLGAVPYPRDERLRIEATLREIDASFGADDVPQVLKDVRERLVAAVAAP
ncbi:AAA family ATPase [Streptomyces sp. NBC_01465]|uniref:AAA family ATPase n=1 Tax=Streptomyces sp. NBC_01465 TaxID=2903878 RepID=UPI002E35FF1E|nr:AAA family ATPase [Streptomyces sp. NBC_01465]